MNEQLIKALWWKARIGYNEQNCDPEVLAKFAELIVRECVNVALKDALPDWDNVASEANTQCVKIAADLKQHFGVEL